jgi:hypothetical protein
MTEILESIVLTTLTFGLATADLNQHDKCKLRTTMTQATQSVSGIPTGRDPTNTWATLELGLMDPVDQIAITDWATVASMVEGNTNPLAAEIVLHDQTLITALEPLKQKWGFAFNQLAAMHKKKRHAWLAHKARAQQIAQTNGTYFAPNRLPVWANSTLSTNHIGMAIQYRCMRAQNQIRALQHCVLCHTLNIEQPTVEHFLSHCAYGAEVARDQTRVKALSAQDAESWKTLDAQGVSDLCAKPQNRESLLSLALDTLQHCQLFGMPFIIIGNSTN